MSTYVTAPSKKISTLREAPLLGSMREFQRDRLAVLRRVLRECGDAGKIHFGPVPVTIINSPELAQAVLVEHASSFDKGFVIHRAFTQVLGSGLLNNEGENWRRQRKLIAPALSARHVASYGDTMVEYTERIQQGWREGEELRIDREMMALTMSIVGKTLFDVDVFSDTDELGAAVTVAMQYLGYYRYRWADQYAESAADIC